MDALFQVLEQRGMENDLIVETLNQLEVEDRVWTLHVPHDNDHDLPSGEFVYLPSDESE
jgi:hypothetical protein